MIDSRYPPLALKPVEFELEVRKILDALGHDIQDYHSEHRERIQGTDGDYEIDVSVRFQALGMSFLVLVECKHYKNPVKREVLQILYDRMRSVGAQKGAIFASSGFQSGALEYASTHNIATVSLVDGRSSYFTKSFGGGAIEPPAFANIPSVAGWLVRGNSFSLVSCQYSEALASFLFSAD